MRCSLVVTTFHAIFWRNVEGFAPRTRFLQRGVSSALLALGPHLAIQEDYPGLKQLHANPDVFLIENFLEVGHCERLIQLASDGTLQPSPVAYAGWTKDVTDLLQLAAKGPVVWASLITAWWQLRDDGDANQISLVLHSLQNYIVYLSLAAILVGSFTYFRAQNLQTLRTSTSTTVNDTSEASIRAFVSNTAQFLGATSARDEASLFEAPTIIRYESGQVLAPHFDANRSADTEDANRGGQTLVTLLLYLNDVREGGKTKFGGMNLSVQPKVGEALVFFPADAAGKFDHRTEHEGCPAVDEKWIARIWRHQNRVPPPFGLSEGELRKL